MKHIFSIDVEDWFHILEADCVLNNVSEWSHLTSRVECAMDQLFEVLDKHDTKATLFFLGWIAEQFPDLAQLACEKGHEIAVHGYYHNLVYDQSYDEFHEEVKKAKDRLEDLTGVQVMGFRAPGFSITRKSLWAYEALIDLGFSYSSSVYPAFRSHGQFPGFGNGPRKISFGDRSILEFPIPVLPLPFSFLNCFGGGYFRLFPLVVYNNAIKFLESRNELNVFYIHPHDIDVSQPKLPLSLIRKFKSYVNVSGCREKIDRIVAKYPFGPFSNLIDTLKTDELLEAKLTSEKGNYKLSSLS